MTSVTNEIPPTRLSPRRTGPPPLVWIFALVLWPLILAGWLLWFAATLTLTALGIVVMAGGVVLWGADHLRDARRAQG